MFAPLRDALSTALGATVAPVVRTVACAVFSNSVLGPALTNAFIGTWHPWLNWRTVATALVINVPMQVAILAYVLGVRGMLRLLAMAAMSVATTVTGVLLTMWVVADVI